MGEDHPAANALRRATAKAPRGHRQFFVLGRVGGGLASFSFTWKAALLGGCTGDSEGSPGVGEAIA